MTVLPTAVHRFQLYDDWIVTLLVRQDWLNSNVVSVCQIPPQGRQIIGRMGETVKSSMQGNFYTVPVSSRAQEYILGIVV